MSNDPKLSPEDQELLCFASDLARLVVLSNALRDFNIDLGSSISTFMKHPEGSELLKRIIQAQGEALALLAEKLAEVDKDTKVEGTTKPACDTLREKLTQLYYYSPRT